MHTRTQADSGDLGWPVCRSVPVPRGASRLTTSKGHVKKVKRGYGRKRDFKRRWKLPLQHAHTTQSRLSKDNQLRSKCSPEGGGIETSPVSLASEHKVCLWWGQLVTAERSQSVHLSQPTLNILTEKADSCIHPGSKMIHSSHTDTHMLHKHIWTPSRGWEVLAQSPFLLCWKEGKTLVRHGGFSAHVERLMGDYRSVAQTGSEQGPSCWTGSHLRHSGALPAVLLTACQLVEGGKSKLTLIQQSFWAQESSQCAQSMCESEKRIKMESGEQLETEMLRDM